MGIKVIKNKYSWAVILTTYKHTVTIYCQSKEHAKILEKELLGALAIRDGKE